VNDDEGVEPRALRVELLRDRDPLLGPDLARVLVEHHLHLQVRERPELGDDGDEVHQQLTGLQRLRVVAAGALLEHRRRALEILARLQSAARHPQRPARVQDEHGGEGARLIHDRAVRLPGDGDQARVRAGDDERVGPGRTHVGPRAVVEASAVGKGRLRRARARGGRALGEVRTVHGAVLRDGDDGRAPVDDVAAVVGNGERARHPAGSASSDDDGSGGAARDGRGERPAGAGARPEGGVATKGGRARRRGADGARREGHRGAPGEGSRAHAVCTTRRPSTTQLLENLARVDGISREAAQDRTLLLSYFVRLFALSHGRDRIGSENWQRVGESRAR
jgi:hypothetical protein